MDAYPAETWNPVAAWQNLSFSGEKSASYHWYLNSPVSFRLPSGYLT